MNSPNKKSPTAGVSPQPSNRQAVTAPQLKHGATQLKTALSAQSVKRPAAPPPVYRPQSKPAGVQAKASGPSQLKNHPAAPPVYRPQPVPRVLQTKEAVSGQAGRGRPEHKPPAFSANRIQKTAGVAQPKAVAAPPPYRPSPPAPPARTHSAAPTPPRPSQKHSVLQRHQAGGKHTPGRANAIQLHPLSIKIPGFNEWKRDTGNINLDEDIALFEAKVRNDNPKITSIEVRRKNLGDHQVVVVGMEGGKFMQMDLSDSGTMLRYDIDENHYSVVVEKLKPKGPLRLNDVFRAFFKVTHAKGFDFENYNCIRFANDLAGEIGEPEKGSKDDEWNLF